MLRTLRAISTQNLALALVAVSLFSEPTSAESPAWPPPADHLTLAIWPGAAPGVQGTQSPEGDLTTAKDGNVGGQSVFRLGNVSIPTVTLYSPQGKNTGAAIVVFPGGSYRILAIDLEGSEVCNWLSSVGVNCLLLKYRVPDSGPYPTSSAAIQDAQRAVRFVRLHAAEWHIDPHKIGVLGFSAGGHLAAVISNQFDRRLYDPIDAADNLSCRPDFAAVIYPGYLAMPNQNLELNPDIHPTSNTPPTFLLQAENDPVHVENVVTYFLALKKVKVSAELHVYAEGGHGYGLRRTDFPITNWPKTFEVWLGSIKILPAESGNY